MEACTRDTETAIPNIGREGCALQDIQLLADHPGVPEGGFAYHHCADLNVTADPELSIDGRW